MSALASGFGCVLLVLATSCSAPTQSTSPARSPAAAAELAQLDRQGLPFAAFYVEARPAAAANVVELLERAAAIPNDALLESGIAGIDRGALERAGLEVASQRRDRVNLLLGRLAYDERRYDDALALLARVSGAEQPRASWLSGLCHVQLRKAVPTAKSLGEVERLLEGKTDPESKYLLELTHLTMARLFYSASIKLSGPPNITIKIDAEKLKAAVKYYGLVDSAGPFGNEALWERGQAYVMGGNPKLALADVDRVLAVPEGYFPEALLVKGDAHWQDHDLEAAYRSYTELVDTYAPVLTELERVIQQPFAQSSGPPAALRAISSAVSDRVVARERDLVVSLQTEQARFARLEFRKSREGQHAFQLLEQKLAEAKQHLAELEQGRIRRQHGGLQDIVERARAALREVERKRQ